MAAQDLQPPAPGLTKYKLTVADYLTLDASGAFEGLRTELIEGDVIVMNAQHRPHARTKMAIYDALRDALRQLDTGLTVMAEVSMEAPPNSLPEPDVLLTSEPDGDGFVPLLSVRLIVEVAETTLKKDLAVKAPLYARLGTPEYWVVDTKGGVIHRMWAPDGETYGESDEVAFGDRLRSATIDGLAIETSTLG